MTTRGQNLVCAAQDFMISLRSRKYPHAKRPDPYYRERDCIYFRHGDEKHHQPGNGHDQQVAETQEDSYHRFVSYAKPMFDRIPTNNHP